LRQELDDTKARVKAEKERMKAVDASVLMAMAARRTQFWWQVLEIEILNVYNTYCNRHTCLVVFPPLLL
jgi:hypothetical protein